jgi:hypothetical protein
MAHTAFIVLFTVLIGTSKLRLGRNHNKIRAKLKESFLIALFIEFLFVIYLIMKTAIQGRHTVLSWIVEIHKSFSIAFVFVGKLLSDIIGVIFF